MDDPDERRRIIRVLCEQCRDADVIVGVAPSTLHWAAWVAEQLGLPMAYVRERKAYGRGLPIEGAAIEGKRIALIVVGAGTPPHLEVVGNETIPLCRE